MTNLPPLPKDRDWSQATWRAGLDEAVRRCAGTDCKTWGEFFFFCGEGNQTWHSTIAHATTLLDAGIVKPVVSEAAVLWDNAYFAFCSRSFDNRQAAIAFIQSALDKARAGQ